MVNPLIFLKDRVSRREFNRTVAGTAAGMAVNNPVGNMLTAAHSEIPPITEKVEEASSGLELIEKLLAWKLKLREEFFDLLPEQNSLTRDLIGRENAVAADATLRDSYAQRYHAITEKILKSLTTVASGLPIEDGLFRTNKFSELWDKAVPVNNAAYRRLATEKRVIHLIMQTDGELDIYFPTPPGTKAGEVIKNDDSVSMLGPFVRHLLSGKKERQRLYETALTLPLPLRQPLIELLVASPTAQPSHALKRMFYKAEDSGITMKELRAEVQMRFGKLVNEYYLDEYKPTKRDNKEKPAALAAWKAATGIEWKFVQDKNPYYEIATPIFKKRTRYMSGIELPHYSNACRIVEIVNQQAASQGEPFTLRASDEIMSMPDRQNAMNVRIPAALFNDVAYAHKADKELKRDKVYSQHWKDKLYWQAVEEKNISNKIFESR